MNDSDISGPIEAPDDPTPTPAEPRRSRRLGRRTIVVTVVALGVAAGGGAIAAAAGGHGPAATSGPGGYGAGNRATGPEGGGMPGHPGGRPGQGDPIMRALHGTFVVPSTSDGSTTYVTDVQQTGTVTNLTATSITLKSADGYTEKYGIGSSTKKASSVTQGSTATVIATGNPATALTIEGPHPRGAGGMRGPGGAPPSGAPAGRPTGAPGGPNA